MHERWMESAIDICQRQMVSLQLVNKKTPTTARGYEWWRSKCGAKRAIGQIHIHEIWRAPHGGRGTLRGKVNNHVCGATNENGKVFGFHLMNDWRTNNRYDTMAGVTRHRPNIKLYFSIPKKCNCVESYVVVGVNNCARCTNGRSFDRINQIPRTCWSCRHTHHTSHQPDPLLYEVMIVFRIYSNWMAISLMKKIIGIFLVYLISIIWPFICSRNPIPHLNKPNAK